MIIELCRYLMVSCIIELCQRSRFTRGRGSSQGTLSAVKVHHRTSFISSQCLSAVQAHRRSTLTCPPSSSPCPLPAQLHGSEGIRQSYIISCSTLCDNSHSCTFMHASSYMRIRQYITYVCIARIRSLAMTVVTLSTNSPH